MRFAAVFFSVEKKDPFFFNIGNFYPNGVIWIFQEMYCDPAKYQSENHINSIISTCTLEKHFEA